MRFGVATGYRNFAAVVDSGFDYYEGNLSTITGFSDEDYSEMLKTVQASPINMEAVNGFYPGNIILVGPKRDMNVIEAYTKKALSRAAAFGVKVAVLGSGESRSVPEGYDFQKAYDEFAEVLKMCGDIAKPYGITIVIEPLFKKGTNLINTAAEGLEMCKYVNHPNVKCLVDFFHVFNNGETLDAVRTAGADLMHIHVARGDRRMPSTKEDIAICREWANALKECGYDSRVSLEGIIDAEGYAETIKSTREILEQVFN